jgi:hypothetical protein
MDYKPRHGDDCKSYQVYQTKESDSTILSRIESNFVAVNLGILLLDSSKISKIGVAAYAAILGFNLSFSRVSG